MPVVQKASHRRQKRNGIPKLIALRAAASGLLCMQPMQPMAGIRIAQSARTVLDIWLEMKQRVPVLQMAFSCQLRQRDPNRFRIMRPHLRHCLVSQRHENSIVPADLPQIQQSQPKLRILRIQTLALARWPRRKRYLQTAVPQRLRHPPYRLLRQLLCTLLDAKEQVHIRIRKQLHPSVSPYRRDRNCFAQLRG